VLHDAWRRAAIRSAAAMILAWAGVAQAAAPAVDFNVPRTSLQAALIAFAVQARLSISTGRARGCADPEVSLVGRYLPQEGLRRLLAGTGCAYRMVSTDAVEVFRAPQPEAAVAPPMSKPLAADVGELVVVATRRPTATARLAYPVSAQSGAALERQGIEGTGDLALVTPSMTVTNLGSGRDKILLRGLSDGPLTGRTQSMVGIYLDNTRITYAAPDPDLRLVDMSQVEVLRGPQGALYGAGSLGGVVRLGTAQPDPAGAAGWVSAEAATTRGGAPSSVIEAMVNLPVLGGRGAVRAVAYRDIQGGYVDDTSLGVKNANRTVREGGRIGAVLDLSPAWRFTAGAVSQFITSDDTQYSQPGVGAYGRAVRVREPHDNDFLEAHLGLRGRFDWGEFNASAAMIRHQVVSRYDATVAPPLATPAGPSAYEDEDDIATLETEATVASSGDPRSAWLAGAFFASTRQTVGLRLTSLAGPPLLLFDEARKDRLEEAALFGQATLPLSARLGLTLGGRLFRTDTRVASLVRTPSAGGAAAFAGAFVRTGFAPKLEATYSFSPRRLIYAQAAEGYRVGGANTTGAPGQAFGAPGGAQPYRAYQGDELWSFELGGRFSFLDDRLTLRAALFEAFWKNIQSDQLLPSGLPFTANIGDGRNRGLELEGNFQDGELLLHGAALINSPELDHANPAFPARADLALAGVPQVSISGDIHYGWDLPRRLRIELDGRYAYVGRSRLTFDASTSPNMGGYGTGRIALSLADPVWRTTLAVDNPFGARGDTFAYGNPFSLRTIRQVTPLRPRTVGLSIQRRF
jgi:iron complex outermembrane receptor protein